MNELLFKITKNISFYRKRLAFVLRQIFFHIHPKALIKPIFIIGCSRAGTTLVYKTFSESEQLGSLQKETHDFWMSLHPLRDRHWDTHSITADSANDTDKHLASLLFYANTGKYRIVDKNNQNGLSVPYLYALYPDAHFIYIKRNPGDNIESLINGWNKPGEFATWSEEITETIAIENGKFQKWCFFLADGWRGYTRSNIEDVCAFQYAAINRSIMDAKASIPPTQWHEVFYESLIAEPVMEFQKLFEACGLSFDKKLRKHCEQVLHTPYNTFSDIGVGKWKTGRYAQKILHVFPSIKQVIIDMGYIDYV